MQQRDLFEKYREPLTVPHPVPLVRRDPPTPPDGNLGRPDPAQANTDCQRILSLLRSGPQLMPQLEEVCTGYRQRVSDLRAAGYRIRCKRVSGRLSEYTLESEPER